MDRTKYMIIDCKRRAPKRDCTVLLCKDRATEKFFLSIQIQNTFVHAALIRLKMR